MSIESVMPSNHLIPCRPLLLLPSIFPSIRVFSNESVLRIGWPKYWSFSFSISPSNEYSGLISFRMDWLDLLEDKGSLKSFLQHHSSKASILWHSASFIVQLSHPYMTTGKTIAWARRTFVGKVMSLFFNMLSRLLIAFLPRSKCVLILWLQSPSAVILEPKKIKSLTVSIISHGFTWDQMSRNQNRAKCSYPWSRVCTPLYGHRMFFLYILKGGRHHGRCAGCLFNGHFPFALTRGTGKTPEENEAFLLGSVCSLLAPEARLASRVQDTWKPLSLGNFSITSSPSLREWLPTKRFPATFVSPNPSPKLNQNHLFKTQT